MAKNSKVDDLDENIEEVDEETQDESEDEEVEDDTVEDDSEEESEEDSDSDEDNEETDEDEDSDEPEFKKRYTRIKGETPEEYIPNLETAYKNSSAEAVRLKQQNKEIQIQLDNIAALVANNPDLAEQIKDGKVPNIKTDPALLKARQDMEDQNKKEYGDWVDAHPDLESDPELQKQVFDEIQDFAEVASKKGRVLGMKEALTMAWTSLGLQVDSKEERVRMKAKDSAARGKSAGTGKSVKKDKTTFSEAQIKAGLQMGLGKSRQEVIKKLATYAT